MQARSLQTSTSSRSKALGHALNQVWPHLLPLLFFAVMFLYFPFRTRFEFDPDEGVNVIKAMLVAQGHPLYREIWSDQPPFFTYLLAFWFRVFGFNVNAARGLVLLCSTTLLWAAIQFLRITWGRVHALAGGLLLVLLPYYPVLSVSTMIGLPALTFAMLSLLALARWHQTPRRLWLVLSAAALALSILTKVFTGFLAPIFAAGIVIAAYQRSGRPLARRLPAAALAPALVWGTVLSGIILGCLLVSVGPQNLAQLLLPHITARGTEFYQSLEESFSILYYLQESQWILLLALFGVLFALRAKKWTGLYAALWALSGFMLLSQHAPVWYHHQLLVTLPAALLAGAAVGEGVRIAVLALRAQPLSLPNGLLAAAVLITFSWISYSRIPPALDLLEEQPYYLQMVTNLYLKEKPFLSRMETYAGETQWIVTDLPMYAFRTGLAVPPPVAVITSKRMYSGELTEDEILAVIREWKPEQILLGRFRYQKLEQYLEEDYRLILAKKKRHYYLRRDIGLGSLERMAVID